MRVFTRIFFYTMLVITVAMSVLGFCLISSSFKNANDKEIARAQSEYAMQRAAFLPGLYSIKTPEKASLSLLAGKLQSLSPDDGIGLYTGEGEGIYSSFSFTPDRLSELTENETVSFFVNEKGEISLCTMSRFSYGESSYILVTSHSLQAVFDETSNMCDTYLWLYMIMLITAVVVMLVLSFMIAKPIDILSAATEKIARGSYSERVEVKSDDEIGTLARNFNMMADEVESHIQKLKDDARAREEFTASFTHELKTPLTSVIGYADMICTRDLTRDETKQAAEFIRNEGMRLESLSHKMMDLYVIRKTDFTLLEMNSCDMFSDLEETIIPQLKKRSVALHTDIEPAYVLIEPDLMKTLLINIIDNSLKAEAKNITITGKRADGRYKTEMRDDGRGMEKSELSHIQEAFYMVDKSRSRKMHGAGLGLAISKEIAQVHGTELYFDSEPGKGTCVSFYLDIKGDE